jgi:two-component system, NtrC family, response regulator HydG
MARSAADDAEGEGQEWLDLGHLVEGSELVGGMVVRSAQMRKTLLGIARLGPHKATVLIYGESGTGKELVARALHAFGSNPKGPFVTFNCSNLLESLAESQLFGHVRGAFTDAREDLPGYFRSANGGTLFLDEIGELPLRLQPKLLRAVETHEVQPVGSSQNYQVDIRLVAATNRDLRTMVNAGQFRDDLYYRLNATTINIAPLRQRREAIGALVGYFIEQYNQLFSKQIRYVSRRALDALRSYNWPGNVRELGHAIQNAVVMTDGERIDVRALPEFVLAIESAKSQGCNKPAAQLQTPSARSEHEKAWPLSLDEVIKQTLLRSLEETEGNRRRAADLLGVSRSTLYRMLARYGLAVGGRRRPPNAGSKPHEI